MRGLSSTKIPSKVKLKFCPFCMSINVQLDWLRGNNDDPDLFSVSCLSCGAEGPPSYEEHKAVSRWNNRKPLPR